MTPVAHAEPACLRIASYQEIPGLERVAEVFVAAYEAIDVCAEVVVLPSERASQWLEAGLVDANVGRVPGFADAANDSVIAVPTPVAALSILPLTRADSPDRYDQISDLDGRIVGIHVGLFALREIGETTNATTLASSDLAPLLRMLRRGRVDVILLDNLRFSHAVTSGEISPEDVTVGRPIVRHDVYHVLNRRHAALIPALDAAIASLVNAGAIQDAMQQMSTEQRSR